MDDFVSILGYFGPETVLPVTSMVATVVGVLMIMGRHTLRLFLRAGWLLLTAPKRLLKPGSQVYSGPHHARADRSHQNEMSAMSEGAESAE